MQSISQRRWRFGRLRPVAALAACLYLLVSALLILCLAHSNNAHSHSQASAHVDVVCIWLQKAISSQVPSTAVIPFVVAAVVFAFLSVPLPARLVRILRLTGRSPPSTLSLA